MSNHSAAGIAALPDAEKKAVQEQLERLLSNPHFSQSRRFPSFLRFVIDQTLIGRPELLKERTLGIEIFGRDADYDTASDPIVRVTATEIRKRIAQYYQEPGHETELRLSLPSGSYVPQFHWPQAPKQNESTEMAAVDTLPPPVLVEPWEAPIAEVPMRRRLRRPATAIVLVAFLALSCGGLAFLWHSAQRAPFDFFWGPVLSTKEPVLFCVADQTYPVIALRDAADPSRKTLLKDDLTAIVIDDLIPVVRVAALLESNGKKFSLKGEGVTDLMDLRGGPTVFIGAFDNAWTLRLTGSLRYHFANDPAMTEFRIVDSTNVRLHPELGDRPPAANEYAITIAILRSLPALYRQGYGVSWSYGGRWRRQGRDHGCGRISHRFGQSGATGTCRRTGGQQEKYGVCSQHPDDRWRARNSEDRSQLLLVSFCSETRDSDPIKSQQ